MLTQAWERIRSRLERIAWERLAGLDALGVSPPLSVWQDPPFDEPLPMDSPASSRTNEPGGGNGGRA